MFQKVGEPPLQRRGCSPSLGLTSPFPRSLSLPQCSGSGSFQLLLLPPVHPIFQRQLVPANASHIKQDGLSHPFWTPRDSASSPPDLCLRLCVQGGRDRRLSGAWMPRLPLADHR